LSYRLIKIHRKFTSAYLLRDKVSFKFDWYEVNFSKVQDRVPVYKNADSSVGRLAPGPPFAPVWFRSPPIKIFGVFLLLLPLPPIADELGTCPAAETGLGAMLAGTTLCW
jgi:hypothetical protein